MAVGLPAGKRGDIQARERQLKTELAQEAVQLSRRRRAAAGSLRTAVEACLADLSMAGSRFDVRIGWEEYAKVSPKSCPTRQQFRSAGAIVHIWALMTLALLTVVTCLYLESKLEHSEAQECSPVWMCR